MWFLVNFLKFSRWIVEEEEKEKTLEDEKLLHHIEQVHWGMSSGDMVEAGKHGGTHKGFTDLWPARRSSGRPRSFGRLALVV